MLPSKIAVMVVIVLGALILVVMAMSGQVANEGAFDLVDGYQFFDSGGNGKMILYKGEEKLAKVVIGPRVDDYRVTKERIYIARRPLLARHESDGTLRDELLPECEYWIIELQSHELKRSKERNELYCK